MIAVQYTSVVYQQQSNLKQAAGWEGVNGNTEHSIMCEMKKRKNNREEKASTTATTTTTIMLMGLIVLPIIVVVITTSESCRTKLAHANPGSWIERKKEAKNDTEHRARTHI